MLVRMALMLQILALTMPLNAEAIDPGIVYDVQVFTRIGVLRANVFRFKDKVVAIEGSFQRMVTPTVAVIGSPVGETGEVFLSDYGSEAFQRGKWGVVIGLVKGNATIEGRTLPEMRFIALLPCKFGDCRDQPFYPARTLYSGAAEEVASPRQRPAAIRSGKYRGRYLDLHCKQDAPGVQCLLDEQGRTLYAFLTTTTDLRPANAVPEIGDAVEFDVDAKGFIRIIVVLQPGSQQAAPAPSDPFVLRAVINDPDGFTNVRQEKSASSPIVAVVKAGEEFRTFRRQSGTWWQVRTASGKVGYMHSSRITVKPRTNTEGDP